MALRRLMLTTMLAFLVAGIIVVALARAKNDHGHRPAPTHHHVTGPDAS